MRPGPFGLFVAFPGLVLLTGRGRTVNPRRKRPSPA